MILLTGNNDVDDLREDIMKKIRFHKVWLGNTKKCVLCSCGLASKLLIKINSIWIFFVIVDTLNEV